MDEGKEFKFANLSKVLCVSYRTGAVLNRSEFAHLVFGFSGRALVHKKSVAQQPDVFFPEFSVFYNTNIVRFVSKICFLVGLAAVKLAYPIQD